MNMLIKRHGINYPGWIECGSEDVSISYYLVDNSPNILWATTQKAGRQAKSHEMPFAIPMLKNKYKNIKPTAKRPKK